MYATAIQIDRPVPPSRLADVFAAATGVARDRVRVVTREEVEQMPQPWFVEHVDLGLQVSHYRGDFPIEVDIFARAEFVLRPVLRQVAHELGVIILTDVLDVDPLSDAEWLMIAPDGSSTVVIADPEEFGADDPAIILEPASRVVYESKHARASLSV